MKTNCNLTAAVLFVSLLECVAQTALPHRFAGITTLPDRTVSLSLAGRAAGSLRPFFDLYVLEASSDLTDWKPLATLVRTNASTNELIYFDSQAPALHARFYRVFTNQFVTPLAKPTGPYAVGRIKRLVTDPSRTNRYHIKTNSSFMVTLWYPAEAPAGVLPGEYVDRKLVQTAGADLWVEPDNVLKMFSFSLPGVPVAASPSAFPVVIYATGYVSPRDTNAEKVEELASHGYVVAVSYFNTGSRNGAGLDVLDSSGTVVRRVWPLPEGTHCAAVYPDGRLCLREEGIWSSRVPAVFRPDGTVVILADNDPTHVPSLFRIDPAVPNGRAFAVGVFHPSKPSSVQGLSAQPDGKVLV